MTIEQVVDTAIGLADADGLAACSMPKVAAALGVGTMSLYRYVPNKATLLQLMADRAAGAVPDDAPGASATWQTTLRYFAQGRRSSFVHHPWLLDVPVLGHPVTPNLRGWLDYGLRALARAGFDEPDRPSTMLLVDGHATASARYIRYRRDAMPSSPEHRTSDRQDDPDGGFEFGLQRIIAGVEQLLIDNSASLT